MLSTHLRLSIPNILLRSVSGLKFCVHFSSPSHVLHHTVYRQIILTDKEEIARYIHNRLRESRNSVVNVKLWNKDTVWDSYSFCNTAQKLGIETLETVRTAEIRFVSDYFCHNPRVRRIQM